jgi:hypothetical protein
MVQVPGQHAIVYAANADGILACSTEHKDGCQMVQSNVPGSALKKSSHRALGYFLADDGRKYIYSAGYSMSRQVRGVLLTQYQAFWFSA